MRIRKLYIKTVATPDFKKHYEKNWKKIIEKTISDSSKIFEKEFGIKLAFKEIEIRDCEHESFPFSYFGFVKDLANDEDKKEYDVTVAFTNAPYFSECDYYPSALATISYRKRLILLSNPGRTKVWREFYKWKYYKNLDWTALKFSLIHELGHLFEARDVKNRKSYMFEKAYISKTCYFNKTNKNQILKNKWKKFQK